jgi:hypothetical protein
MKNKNNEKRKSSENLTGKAYFLVKYGDDANIIQVNSKQSKAVCEEATKTKTQHGKEKPQYILTNTDRTHHILKIKIDNGVFTNMQAGENRCDFLLIVENDKTDEAAVFVEIKGKDWHHGLRQLAQTITIMQPNLTNCTCFARLVTTDKTPNLHATQDFINYTKPFKKLINGDLRVGKQKIEESASTFFVEKKDTEVESF